MATRRGSGCGSLLGAARRAGAAAVASAAPGARETLAGARERGQQKVRQPHCASSVTCSFVFGLFARAARRPWGTQGRGFAGNGRRRETIPGRILARMRRAAQQAGRRGCAPGCAARARHEYAFLVGPLIDAATLRRAEAEALDCGVATHEVLLATGLVSHDDYAAALARKLGVPVVAWDIRLDASRVRCTGRRRTLGLPAMAPWAAAAACCRDRAPRPPNVLFGHVAALRERGIEVVLASQRAIDAALARCAGSRADRSGRARPAARSGRRAPPRTPAATWQTVGGHRPSRARSSAAFAVVPEATYAALTALIALPFLCVTLLRLVALQQALAGSRRQRARRVAAIRAPPRLAAAVLHRAGAAGARGQRAARAGPVAARPRLPRRQARDLPGARGRRRRDAGGGAGDWRCPATSASLVVPDRAPRTKPKALNYALQFARGEFVVVYDAEDRPQPDQLRRAWEVFRHAPPGARLPAGAAQHLQSAPELAHPPVHDRVFRAVRCHPAGAGAAAAAGAAGRHVEPFSARHADRRRRLGPLQRHRGRRPRHSPGAAGLPHGRAGLDHVGGGAAGLRHLDQAAHALAQGLDAPCQVSPVAFKFQRVRVALALQLVSCRNAVATTRINDYKMTSE